MAAMPCGCMTFSIVAGIVTLVTTLNKLNFYVVDKTADETAS
jgi:hypothetical protein